MNRLAFWIALALTSPLVILVTASGHATYITVAQALSLIPGVTGRLLRRAFYCRTLKLFDPSSRIGFGSYFRGRSIRVEANTLISSHCVIWDYVSIGERTIISAGCKVVAGRKQHPIVGGLRSIEGERGEPILIGNDVWIGTGAIIMESVGDGAQVGAGSVVVHAVPAGMTAVGNPARVTADKHNA